MDISPIIEDLNDAQRQAVTADPGHCLVLAGAGSGKTRVLVRRIAWLIQAYGVSPFAIMAVTFTNKAAGEMRARIETLLEVPTQGMWIGTFHSIAHRMLRRHWQEAGLPEAFQIMDSEDQLRLVKRLLKDLNIDDNHFQPRECQWFINGKKDRGLRVKDLSESGDIVERTYQRIYQAYEEACERSGMIDFNELLLRAFELMRDNASLRHHYQQRFQHILIDEFQDTNTIQYAWIKLFAGAHNFIMAVGDDDQSIYGWRGAKIENIQRFTQDFKNTQTIRLEQNYRSTETILEAANAVIDNNHGRLGKTLWTDGNTGDPIALYAAFNDLDESRFIVSQIQQWTMQGNMRKEAAILYRSNAQSRLLEEALIQAGVPYRVYGGLRFFDRAEIKDAMAYLRLVSNRSDDGAFERVINTPTRGIGNTTVMAIRDHAKQHQTPLWAAAQAMIQNNVLSARASNAVKHFIDLIDRIATDVGDLPLHEQTEHSIECSGLRDHYRKERGEKGRARLENLDELINATRQFDAEDSPFAEEEDFKDMPLLAQFISHAALEAGEHQSDFNDDCVQLMTLHSAKGLEFPLVFLAGMEEGLFPHKMSMEDPGRLEEERRLCYVGMTRAMQKLYLTYAESRRLYGQQTYQRPSRFIREIPSELIEEVRMRNTVRRANPGQPSNTGFRRGPKLQDDSSPYKMGQVVHHPKFGEGVILNVEGSGEQTRLQIKFGADGVKWLLPSFAKLTLC